MWSRSSRLSKAETAISIAAIRESLRGVNGCLCRHDSEEGEGASVTLRTPALAA